MYGTSVGRQVSGRCPFSQTVRLEIQVTSKLVISLVHQKKYVMAQETNKMEILCRWYSRPFVPENFRPFDSPFTFQPVKPKHLAKWKTSNPPCKQALKPGSHGRHNGMYVTTSRKVYSAFAWLQPYVVMSLVWTRLIRLLIFLVLARKERSISFNKLMNKTIFYENHIYLFE